MAELAAELPLQVVAQRPLLAQPLQVLVLLAKDVVVRVQRLLLVPWPLLAQAPREAAVAQEAAERLTRSFSAAMAGILP